MNQDHSVKGISVIVTDPKYVNLFNKKFILLWKTDNFYSIGNIPNDSIAITYLSRKQFDII